MKNLTIAVGIAIIAVAAVGGGVLIAKQKVKN